MPSKLFYVALALCLINPVVGLAFETWDTDIIGFVTQVSAVLIVAPKVSWLQIAAALLVRRWPDGPAAFLLVVLSLAAACDYVRFVFSVDLAHSSTAGVALILYPIIRQPLWVLPVGTVLVWLARRRAV